MKWHTAGDTIGYGTVRCPVTHSTYNISNRMTKIRGRKSVTEGFLNLIRRSDSIKTHIPT